jgi:hypothetical protein
VSSSTATSRELSIADEGNNYTTATPESNRFRALGAVRERFVNALRERTS